MNRNLPVMTLSGRLEQARLSFSIIGKKLISRAYPGPSYAYRNIYPERTAFANLALKTDLPPEHFDNAFGYGQANTRTFYRQ